MRIVLGIVVVCGSWAVAGPVRAGEAEDVVDQAIKAHGGTEALTRAQTAEITSSVTQYLGPKPITVKAVAARVLPDRWRSTCYHDDKVVAIFAVNGDRGWTSTPGPPADMAKDVLAETRDEGYTMWLTTLVPLKGNDITLKIAEEQIKVDGKETIAVLVTRKGWPKVLMYFDKKSHLLVKIARRAQEAGGKVNKEYFFTDFKKFDSAMMPTHEAVFIEGKKRTDETDRQYKFPKTIDENVFKRP
jgi:hypothetical protein